MSTSNEHLLKVWARAKDVVGLLGPGPVESHLVHSAGFLSSIPPGATTLLDLGSGAGVPGLYLAMHTDMQVMLLDGAEKRASFLQWAVEDLGLSSRVSVAAVRAEVAGRNDHWREKFDVVTARSFASPAVTAECAAPFLAIGATLLVSEPPVEKDRWPSGGLAELGLRAVGGGPIAAFEKVAPLSNRYPRRVGIPNKRPLF